MKRTFLFSAGLSFLFLAGGLSYFNSALAQDLGSAQRIIYSKSGLPAQSGAMSVPEKK